jgi:transposase
MVCVLSDNEEPTFRQYKFAELLEFKDLLQTEDRIAVEATSTTRFFYSQVAPLVAGCVVVNPSQFEIIKKSFKKTDKNDALNLARFLSNGQLPTSRMKNELQAEVNSLATTRDKFVKLRTILLNKIHAHLKGNGYPSRKEAYDHPANLKKVLDFSWSAAARIELEVIVNEILNLTGGITKLEKEISERGAEIEGSENLNSIKGIGKYSAAVLLSVIGDVNDFADEHKLASYFGIVPRVSNSNQTQHHGSITKQGSKLARTVLVQCTLTAKRFSPYLKQYYERIKARRGSGKAIIATARKFLGIIYRTLKYKWVFSDFPNFVLAEQ